MARRTQKKPTTPAAREATFRAELRRVANLSDTPARVRRWLLALADGGEYGEGTNRPEPTVLDHATPAPLVAARGDGRANRVRA